MAQIVVRQLTQQEWEELECHIDSLQVFEKIFNALSEDAKQEFHLYVKDMISEGLDYESSRNDYHISVETLEKLQNIDQTQQLLLAPEFLFALLEGFVIFHIEECHYQAYLMDHKDVSESNSIDGNVGTANVCPHCILL